MKLNKNDNKKKMASFTARGKEKHFFSACHSLLSPSHTLRHFSSLRFRNLRSLSLSFSLFLSFSKL